ncbi:MAG: hypothetical protein LBF16_05600 [Pseudomonadales bacterium]|jgi:hypothetical protein|nr:hypothetical protein [Pseudomonadales bacterium]
MSAAANNGGSTSGGANSGANNGANNNNAGMAGMNGGGASGGGVQGGVLGTQNGGGNGNGNGGDIAYGSSDDPFAGLGQPGGGTSLAERRAALDARLQQSYGALDGVIVAEREKGQSAAGGGNGGSNGDGQDEEGAGGAAGAGAGGDELASSGFGGASGLDLRLPGAGSALAVNGGGSNSGSGYMPGPATRQGDYDNIAGGPTFAPPPDIPTATNDDVVARQLREAAMREPDAPLREKLWNEYRKYTGLPESVGK